MNIELLFIKPLEHDLLICTETGTRALPGLFYIFFKLDMLSSIQRDDFYNFIC